MTRLGFVINLDACCDHRGCMTACMRKNETAPGYHYMETFTSMDTSGDIGQPATYFMPFMCQHCDNPSCLPACPHDVIVKRDDGLVVMGDTEACVNCADTPCVAACPYEAIVVEPVAHRAGKCDGCADLVAQGKPPECVPNCYMRAIAFGDFDDPDDIVNVLVAQYGDNAHVLAPETGNGPSTRYLLSRRPWRDRESLYSPAWRDEAAR